MSAERKRFVSNTDVQWMRRDLDRVVGEVSRWSEPLRRGFQYETKSDSTSQTPLLSDSNDHTRRRSSSESD